MNVMVTGGAGYIGSHAVKRLLRDGHTVVAVDNLSKGHSEAIDALQALAPDRLRFIHGDIADRHTVEAAMRDHTVQTVMHFAALAEVGESVAKPLLYHRNNTAGALSLLEAADAAGVSRFIFSSTCATYGEPDADNIPIRETCPQRPINPYGRSKLAFERILEDYTRAAAAEGKPFACASLRYFNVAGADQDGLLGEDHDPESHLIPIALQAAIGQRDRLKIFGTDYPTPDGTCIRDYIHVDDLIDAHVAVMDALKTDKPAGDARAYNLGIGRGYSVREVIESARRVTGVNFRADDADRRPGDPPILYADPSKIQSELGWSARIADLDQIIATAWRWMRDHPLGWASGDRRS